MLVAVTGATLQVGLPMLAGNRDAVSASGGWVGRAQRAHRNMLESLMLFAAVLIAVITNKTNSATVLQTDRTTYSYEGVTVDPRLESP
jgi:uncharacterized MAPEG superfamily protein